MILSVNLFPTRSPGSGPDLNTAAGKEFHEVRDDLRVALSAVRSEVDGIEEIASLDGMSLESSFAAVSMPLPPGGTC